MSLSHQGSSVKPCKKKTHVTVCKIYIYIFFFELHELISNIVLIFTVP